MEIPAAFLVEPFLRVYTFFVGAGCRPVPAGAGPCVWRCTRWPAGAGCRPVPGRASEGAPGGRPVPVAGRCRPVPGRASEGAGCRPVPVGGRCRLPASGGALFASWKLLQFPSSLIVKVILAIFTRASAQLSLVSGMPLPSMLWRLGHVHVWHAAARRQCCGMKNIGTEAPSCWGRKKASRGISIVKGHPWHWWCREGAG